MTRLSRDKRTGDYYTADRKYQIEKGTTGWNVNELDPRGWYSYSYSCDTLREAKESIGNEEGESQKGNGTMKIFKVGFKSSVCYSVNMIWANTGKEEREAVEETAARRAERYGYEVAFVEEISETEANSNLQKGMPYYSIDEQAELDHDPSFTTEAETKTIESTEGGEESAPAFTIAHNDEFNGTEVSFPGKPSEEVRSTLKALGFRWHSKRRVWYGRKDADELRAALTATIGCAEAIRAAQVEPKQSKKPVKGTAQDHIRIYWNGIKVDGGKLVRCFYSLDNNADHAPSVSISARDYDHLPRDLFEVRNDTDIYTDYFDSDRAYLTPEHPLYKYFRYAAAKAKIRDLKAEITRYEKELDSVERWPGRFEHVREYLAADESKLAELEAMTDPGQPTAEDLAEIDRQRQEAENARKAAEHEAELREREIYLAQRVNGQRLIKAEQDAHPIEAGEPVVCINWSEHPAFEAYADDELVLSLTAAENILRELDHEQHETRESDSGRGWYFKTKFTITGTDAAGEPFTYTGRYDLGDGDGGLVKHIRSFGEYCRTHDGCGREIENPPETNDTIDFSDFLAGHVEAVEVREIIDPDGIHKRTIAKSGTAYIVTFFEMMGGRWVPLSDPERWSPELVQELVEA